MSVYDLHFNKDDVTIRNILIGLLATLHETIYWYNQVGNDIKDRRQIKVPFYFSTTGTERYLQDNFLNNIDFDPENLKAEAFYNAIPRGIVDLTGINVEAQAIVNKYVRMNHQVQEQDGTLNTYSTEAFWVPIILNADCKVYTDSIVDQLKCTEAIIKTFFKNKSYQVDVAYTRIPCLILFPDDYTNERTVEFSFTEKREFTTSFALQIKAYIPVFKEGTSIFAGNNMSGFQTNLNFAGAFGSGSAAGPGANEVNADNQVGTPTQPPASPILPGGTAPITTIPDTGGDSLLGNNPASAPPTPTETPQSFGNGPNIPSWPQSPRTILPPEGGTANVDPDAQP
jgi:hypothetical protein